MRGSLWLNNWMISASRLPDQFFNQPTLVVARALLGTRLVRLEGGERTAGIIVETEAYIGEEDLGCHASAGYTPRTQIMYGSAGHAYVYFTYGMHWMLNFVTEAEGFPAAVLIRGIIPTEGIERIASRRVGRPIEQWTNGPGKICQALSINRIQNGADLCAPEAELFVECGIDIPDSCVTNSPRVGLNSVPEPWKSLPWRFVVKHETLEANLIFTSSNKIKEL
jgi:DNA-3-methyladenine glycosylase